MLDICRRCTEHRMGHSSRTVQYFILGLTQGFVIKGINHTGQIFLTRPSVWSCVRHGCHPLEKIPADLSDDWTFLIGHLIRLLDFSFDQAQTPPTLPPTPFLRVCTSPTSIFFNNSFRILSLIFVVFQTWYAPFHTKHYNLSLPMHGLATYTLTFLLYMSICIP